MSLVNSVNPFRIEGQKTASFEIVDVLGDAPDIHCLPVGNAGNITAYWKGYREYAADGDRHAARRGCGASRPPGAAPIVIGQVVEEPEHHRHRDPDRQPRVVDQGARRPRRVRRRIDAVTDRADPGRLPAAGPHRGASSSSRPRPRRWPVCCRWPPAGELEPGQRVVCTVTGNGLKDPEWAISGAPAPLTIPVDAAAAAAQLGL